MRRAQVKFGETIGIIIIVYLVLVVGLGFWNNSNNKDIEELVEQDKEAKAFDKYFYIINSPMLRVSERGNIDNEFDLLSIKTFGEFSKTPEGAEFLRRQLGEAKITLEYYPSSNFVPTTSFPSSTPNSITLYENFDGNTEFDNTQIFRSVIPIYNSEDNLFYIGILEVEVPYI